ncbi:hypothetical protein N2152v2_007382 [Parachlorella kessleri]
MGKLGVEVVIARLDKSKVPAVPVPGGEPVLQLRPATSTAGKVRTPPLSSVIRDTLWQLDAAAPQELLLVEYGFSTDWEETSARVAFGAPLLPSIGAAVSAEGSLLAAVTADGALHLLHVPAGLQQARGGSGAAGRRASMAAALRQAGAVRSVQLAPAWVRAGTPTAVLMVDGHACVGTDQGTVVCLPVGSDAQPLDESDAFELKSGGGGLSKVFGGLWGKPAGQAVAQMLSLYFLGRELLLCVHEEGQLRLWDVGSRRLAYQCDMLPPAAAAALVPTHAALIAEPLDASIFVLLVYYQARAGEGPGELRTYELFVEARGEATYKVDLESGPQLPGTIHRLHSLALESVGPHAVGAWMLYDDEAGRRRVVCVPLAFNDATVRAAAVVHLIEDQLRELGCDDPAAPIYAVLWRAVEANLATAGPAAAASGAPAAASTTPAGASTSSQQGEPLAAAFMDALLAPGRVSRPALHAALGALSGGGHAGGLPSLELLAQSGLEEVRQQLPGWLAAATAGAANWQGAGALGPWCALARAYSSAWAREQPLLALVQAGPAAAGGVLLVREGGWVSHIRQGAAPELAFKAEVPATYAVDHASTAAQVEAVAAVLQAASQLMAALGGPVLGRLAWSCLQRGLDLRGSVYPAFIAALATGGGGPPPQWGQNSDTRAQWTEWRAQCRMLPLELGRLLGKAPRFADVLGQVLEMLQGEYSLHGTGEQKLLQAPARQVTGPLAAAAAQVCAARVQCLFQLSLLGSYVSSVQALGQWSLSPHDTQQLATVVLPKAEQMLREAAVGYWASVTPLQLPADLSTIDPAQLVISLRIGDSAQGASKRARLSAAPDTYVTDLLVRSTAFTSQQLLEVRDLAELQSAELHLGELLTGVTSPDDYGMQDAGQDSASHPSQVVLQVALELFKGSYSAHMAAMLRLLPDTSDGRLLFLKACSIARSIPSSGSAPGQRQQQLDDSASLFFRAAGVLRDAAAHGEEAGVVADCIRQLQEEMAGAYKDEGSQALELQYYETVMMLFERLGCPEAASKFACAATEQVHVALPGPQQSYARLQREGRLWANVFAHALEDGKYEEAYAAMLSNTVAEVQLDCMQRLVHSLCNAGRVQLLCALPFSANLLVQRDGHEVWVTLLEEVVACLQRRAESLPLDATPQPYKVLYAFHAARGNWQAAAAAMLACSRRLVGEGAGSAAALTEAELALGAAVSALSLVVPSQAWLEDPAGRLPERCLQPLFPQLSTSKRRGATGGNEGEELPPAILTLKQLRQEYAVARAHAVVAAAIPGGEATSSQPDNVFSQLLALGLHEAAISLAESIYTGTRLTRALEQAFASQAAYCTRLQLQSGAATGALVATSAAAAAGGTSPLGGHPGLGFAEPGDGMEEDAGCGEDAMQPGFGMPANFGDGSAGGEGHGATSAATSAWGSPATAAAWRQLKRQLLRFEQGEHGKRLRLLTIESALATERRLSLPPWLIEPFKAGSGDVAGLMRVLMRFNRLEEAAQLATRYLGLALRSELVLRLKAEANSGSHGAERWHKLLVQAVREETEAATRQTTVLQQREGSIASGGGEDSSFGGSSAFEASAHGSETEEHPAGQDETSNSMELLNQQGNIQEALFGVLYMLSKERLAEGWKFVLFAMTVDYLQLAVFFISYNFPWDFDSSAWYWKWLNYHIYLGVFYTLVGVLLAALVLCTVIGVKFKDNSFTYVWPVQMLKAAMIFFFEVFYISILGIFTVALDCTFSSAPILNEVIAITMAYFVAVTNSELDPACEAIAGIIITTYLCFEYVRYVPFKTSWINGLQASFFGSLSWASLLILLMAFFFQGSKIITFTVLLWAEGVIQLYRGVQACLLKQVALKWRLALKTGVPVVHKFLDEQEVVARCGRIRDQWGDTIPDWIDTAEAVFKAGIDQFPESAYLHIAYSSFLIYQRRSAQAGLALLKASRKLEPSIGERFTIFTSYKALLEVHKQALKTTRNFWRQLCHKDVSFAKLTRSFTAMDAAEKHADKTFKFVLDRHPNSAKLLRAYGTYLESVKTQPTQGARYHAEAQRLEDQAAQHGGLTYGDDGDKSSQLAEWSVGASVNESSDAVMNKKAVQMFGYKLGDLDGKPVSLLMPPPFSSHHSQYMQRYKKTGKSGSSKQWFLSQAAHVGKPAAPVLALHAEGFNFAVSLTVKLLQQGDAKRVMGIFKPVKDDDHVGQMWVGVMGNIIGVDRGLQDLLGYHSSDLSGQTVSAVGADGGVEHHLKHCADRLKAWQYTREELDTTFYSFEVPWKHKYGAPMTVSVHASYSGTEHVRLILGYVVGMLMARRKTIADLLGTPFAQLHLRWMQMAARTVEPAAVCPISCRSGRPVVLLGRNNKQVAVRMEVVPTQVGKLCCLTAAVTEVDVRGMDAWGGGDLKELVKRCKRMLLLVHGNGTVLAVNVDPTVASHRFGQAEDFASQEHSLLFGTSPKKLQAPVTAAERQLYLSEDRGVTEVERWPFSTAVLLDPTLKRRANPASLWDLSNRFVTAIRLTAVPPAGIASSLSNYSVMIVFFAVEAAAVIPLCCLCLWLVVNLVNRDRLKLVNIFLVVPRPVVMQLASKDVNVNSEDTDGEEADDNNNDAWKQQENEEVDTAGGAQSSLHDRSLQTCALKLLAPFTVWCVIVCIVYGVSIIVLQTSVDPIVNLIAANRIPFFVSSIVGYTVAATATADNGPGGTAAFYQGMAIAMKRFGLGAGFRVATYDANFLTFDTTAVDFILSVALPGGCLAVVAVVLSLVVAWYYYFYLLLPYLRMVKEERHRVAVLLSQLPREMNAEAVVRKSASEDEHGDQHSANSFSTIWPPGIK